MRSIGTACGIELLAPNDAYLSYFNSPYTGHLNNSAIDIYPSHGEWNGPCPSPISGKVVNIRRIRMGKSRGFLTPEYDFSIGIKPATESHEIVRVLHCEPSVEVGQEVEAGENLGKLIRSRYFNFWTGPHLHAEILDIENIHRASKSYPLKLPYEEFNVKRLDELKTEIECTIVELTKDVVIVISNGIGYGTLDDLVGLTVSNGRHQQIGVMDAGIPYYEYGGIHSGLSQLRYDDVFLFAKKIGECTINYKEFSRFRVEKNLNIRLDNAPMKGISSFLYPKAHRVRCEIPIRLIPQEYATSFDFTIGDFVQLSLYS